MLSVEATSSLFLFAPTCFASLFLMARVVIVFFEQRALRKHARYLFSYLLLVLPRVQKKDQAHFLLTRYTFYETLLKQKKIYMADLEFFQKYVDMEGQDAALKESLHFLKYHCLHDGRS